MGVIKAKAVTVKPAVDSMSYMTINGTQFCVWPDGWEDSTPSRRHNGDSIPARECDECGLWPDSDGDGWFSTARGGYQAHRRCLAENRSSDTLYGGIPGKCQEFNRVEKKRGRPGPEAMCSCGEPLKAHGDQSDSDGEKAATTARIIRGGIPGKCAEFDRAEKRRGRPGANDLCVCGEPLSNHGTPKAPTPPLPTPKPPASPATPSVTVKAPPVQAKAPNAVAKPVARPVVVRETVGKLTAAELRAQAIAAVKANPKAAHKYYGASVGKPAKTAICVACGAEWQDNVHTKGA